MFTEAVLTKLQEFLAFIRMRVQRSFDGDHLPVKPLAVVQPAKVQELLVEDRQGLPYLRMKSKKVGAAPPT